MSPGCERGVVFAEFLIAFPVIFVLFLGIVQASLLGAASLVVRHAAYRAAREASVVLDEDPEHLEDAARMTLRIEGDTRRGRSAQDGPRTERLRDAAFGALAALAPPTSVVGAWASGSTPALDEGALNPDLLRAAAAMLYTSRATELQVGASQEGGVLVFSPEQTVRVHVRYQFICTVPIANALLCDSLVDVPGSVFLEEAVDFQLPRLLELEGSAEMAIHHANYRYRSEHGER